MVTPQKWSADGIASQYVVHDDDGAVLWTGPAAELKALVLACPEAAKKLGEHPLNYGRTVGGKQIPDPQMWSGFLPPRLWGGLGQFYQRNESPMRAALLDVVKTALARQEHQPKETA